MTACRSSTKSRARFKSPSRTSCFDAPRQIHDTRTLQTRRVLPRARRSRIPPRNAPSRPLARSGHAPPLVCLAGVSAPLSTRIIMSRPPKPILVGLSGVGCLESCSQRAEHLGEKCTFPHLYLDYSVQCIRGAPGPPRAPTPVGRSTRLSLDHRDPRRGPGAGGCELGKSVRVHNHSMSSIESRSRHLRRGGARKTIAAPDELPVELTRGYPFFTPTHVL